MWKSYEDIMRNNSRIIVTLNVKRDKDLYSSLDIYNIFWEIDNEELRIPKVWIRLSFWWIIELNKAPSEFWFNRNFGEI